MTIRWLQISDSALPEGDAWLGLQERKVLATLRFPKRRAEWKLGRYAAKRAISEFVGVDELSRIEVMAAEDGAPEAYVDGTKLDSGISISHREGRAACAIAPGARLGCDLEAVEPRTPRFVNDFFTEQERVEVEKAAAADRDRLIALIWSAKESALKALRVGLRRDTRSVEVEIGALGSSEPGWHPLRAQVSPEGRSFEGWWREEAGFVLTVVLP